MSSFSRRFLLKWGYEHRGKHQRIANRTRAHTKCARRSYRRKPKSHRLLGTGRQRTESLLYFGTRRLFRRFRRLFTRTQRRTLTAAFTLRPIRKLIPTVQMPQGKESRVFCRGGRAFSGNFQTSGLRIAAIMIFGAGSFSFFICRAYGLFCPNGMFLPRRCGKTFPSVLHPSFDCIFIRIYKTGDPSGTACYFFCLRQNLLFRILCRRFYSSSSISLGGSSLCSSSFGGSA